MTQKPRLHAFSAGIAEALFTLSDWLFSAGYALKHPRARDEAPGLVLRTVSIANGVPVYGLYGSNIRIGLASRPVSTPETKDA